MTEPTSSPRRRWVLRAAAAVLWLVVCVLGVITHAPVSIAAGAVLALIFAYRAYLSYTTRTRPGGS
jgi:O-antigen ligase